MSSTTVNNHFVLVSEGEWADGVALFIGLPSKEAIEACDIGFPLTEANYEQLMTGWPAHHEEEMRTLSLFESKVQKHD